MNIRFVGIDGLGGHEVNRLFSTLTDAFDFIKEVGIREFNNSCGEALNIYDVTIEFEPVRDAISIHIFDNAVYFVICGCGYRYDKAIVHIARSAYERLEII